MGIRPAGGRSGIVGQSYRLTREPNIFPRRDRLTDRFSDIVGGTRRFGRLVDVTHRYRVDKGRPQIRRNELD
jgi:LPS-assembly protein